MLFFSHSISETERLQLWKQKFGSVGCLPLFSLRTVSSVLFYKIYIFFWNRKSYIFFSCITSFFCGLFFLSVHLKYAIAANIYKSASAKCINLWLWRFYLLLLKSFCFVLLFIMFFCFLSPFYAVCGILIFFLLFS